MISRKDIINAAYEEGFDLVGVVPAEALSSERKLFDEWLMSGSHSTLSYLERNVDKRFDPRLLVEGCRSVVVCAVSYLSKYSRGYAATWPTKVASYALARDYHLTIKEMLQRVAQRLMVAAPDMRYRAFTDSAPVAEKSLAVRAGLGWIGRNSLVVNPRLGSMMHLGELFISEEVDVYDRPMEGVRCGVCRKCVDSCPNGAIMEGRGIATQRCISCRTIEREGSHESIILDGWIYGCDACQSVCPFNSHAPEYRNAQFAPLFDPLSLDASAWRAMSDDEFMAMAGDTAMTRAGLERIKGNISK